MSDEHTMGLHVKGVPAQLMRKMRMRAAAEDITVKELVIRALTQYLEREIDA